MDDIPETFAELYSTVFTKAVLNQNFFFVSITCSSQAESPQLHVRSFALPSKALQPDQDLVPSEHLKISGGNFSTDFSGFESHCNSLLKAVQIEDLRAGVHLQISFTP